MTTINLATYAVRDAASGSVDLDATMDKFAADLETFVAQVETEEETVSAAVNSVFDDLNGTRANVPYVISASLQKLNVSAHPGMFKILSDKVHSYLSSNSQGKTNKETGAVERPDSLFIIGRGRGAGGVQRRADIQASK